METREGYKKTELGWIPEEWDVLRLKDCCDFIQDGTHFSPKSKNGPFKYITSKNIKNGKIDLTDVSYISEDEHNDIYRKCPVEFGDVLLTKDGANTGNLAINTLSEPFSLLSSVAYLRSNPKKTSNHYIFHYLSSPIGQKTIKNSIAGQAITRITLSKINNFYIFLPPLPEQQKIAEILTTVDDKISSIQDQIKLTEQLKKGLMEKLLTEGIGHTEFKDTEIGRIPKGWDVKPLGAIGVFMKGKGISKKDLVADGIPCVRYGEIYTVHHWIIKKFYSFIDIETASQSFEIKHNDILFAGSGETVEDIGKAVAYIGHEIAYAGGDTIIFRGENIHSAFFSAFLNSDKAIIQKRKMGQGNSVVHIYHRDLMRLMAPIPPLPEQKQIATILSSVDDKLDILQSKKTNYETLKKGLMEQLLTGKRRVTLSS